MRLQGGRVLRTSANALWHVLHFVLLLCIWSDMCTSFWGHKPCWVFRSFCYTNQFFYCECYLNLYWSMNYHCMWQMRIVICMAIHLIWLDLTYIDGLVQDYSNSSVLAMDLLQLCFNQGHTWSVYIRHRIPTRQWPLLLTWFNYNPSINK